MARLKVDLLHEDRAASPGPSPDSPDSANDNGRTPHKQYDIYYRQILPSEPASTPGPANLGLPAEPQATTSSSSYDYWWPFPPGGVATTSSTSVSFVAPTSLDVLQSSSQLVPSPISTILFSSLTVSTDALSISGTGTSTTDSSTFSSQTIITITAESQTTTPTLVVYPKMQSHGLKPATYLIPVFVVVGVVLGCITAWVGWGCITRKPRVCDFSEDDATNRKRGRRKPRRSELEVGPAYCPSLSDKTLSLEESSVHEKAALAPAANVEVFSWRGMDIDGGKDALEKDSECAYLVPPISAPSKPNSRAKSVASRSKRRLSRAATGKTTASISVYSQVDDDEYEYDEDEPVRRDGDDGMSLLDEFESDYDPRSPRLSYNRKKLQEKSTPKSTATPSTGRVASVSRRRPKHARQESDLCLEHVTQGRGRPTTDLSRNTTTRTERSTRTASSAQTGFCMIEGSPLPTPAMSSDSNSDNGGGFFWSKSIFGGPKSNADRYTALPGRDRSSGCRSRSSSPVKKNSKSSPSKYGSRSRAASKDQYPLPRSPPLVTSPKLENSLCFTPVLGSKELGKGATRGC